jgi:3-methylcrotonyl-CoA carboxylase alpha subunit/acetyl-CoA/propionyl-CoA carboxylase biotin carboxyl carrier protein
MLGKVIVHGPSRDAARRLLVEALDDTAILGLTTNAGFLRAVAASDQFAAAAIDTSWLDGNFVDVDLPDEAWVLAAWAIATTGDTAETPFDRNDGWRLGGPAAPIRVDLRHVDDGGSVGSVVQVWPVDHRVRFRDRELTVVDAGSSESALSIDVDGVRVRGRVLAHPARIDVAYRGQTWTFARPDVFGGATRTVLLDGTVTAPMPGTVLEVRVETGQQVTAGDVLGVLEAMKMELALTSPSDGTVVRVEATPGGQFELGATLLVVEPAAPDEG